MDSVTIYTTSCWRQLQNNLQNNQTRKGGPAVLQEVAERAVHNLKGEKLPGVDILPDELHKQGG